MARRVGGWDALRAWRFIRASKAYRTAWRKRRPMPGLPERGPFPIRLQTSADRKHPAGTADGESRNVTGSSKVGRRVTLSPTVTLTVDRAETRPRPQGRRCLW